MANAINIIDGLDGLASGITLFGLLAVSVVGYLGGIPLVTWMSTLLIGCLLGFLVYNSRPASIFLGDCGSHSWFIAGCLSLLASFREGGVLDNGIFPVLAFAFTNPRLCLCDRPSHHAWRSPFSQIWRTFSSPLDVQRPFPWKISSYDVGYGILLFASSDCRNIRKRRSTLRCICIFWSWRVYSNFDTWVTSDLNFLGKVFLLL